MTDNNDRKTRPGRESLTRPTNVHRSLAALKSGARSARRNGLSPLESALRCRLGLIGMAGDSHSCLTDSDRILAC